MTGGTLPLPLTRSALASLASLALALVAGAAGASPRTSSPATRGPERGRVVLMSSAFELDEPSARAIAGADGYLRLSVGPRDPAAPDPLARSGAPSTELALDPSDHRAANDHDAAVRLRAASCIVLTADRVLDAFHLLLPGGAPSRVGLALQEAHAAGAVVVGAGAAASFLGEWALVPRAALEKAARNPRRPRPDLFLEGLGLVRGALVDTAVSARTAGDGTEAHGAERLVRALSRSGADQGIWLAGEVAWLVDARSDSARVLGPGEVVLFDTSRARRLADALRGGRLARLSAGAAWELRARRLAGETAAVACTGEAGAGELPELFDETGLARMLGDLPACGTWHDGRARLVLAWDEDSRRLAGTRGSSASFSGLRFDLDLVPQ